MIGQAIGAYTDATHGMTLSAVSLAYYRYIMPYGLDKLARYAVNVWGVNAEGRDKKNVAEEGLEKMGEFMREIGVAMRSSEVGVTEEIIPGIAKATLIMDGGYKVLTTKEVEQILRDSL